MSKLTKAMQAISLNWLNRWLGSGLGALKFLLLTSVVIGAIEFVGEPLVEQSFLFCALVCHSFIIF